MLLILRELAAGSSRFNDIRRGVPRISATLLKQRLDALEHAGVVERTPTGKGDAQRYKLTEAGQELKPVLTKIGEWGQRWARDISPDDLDPGWLVWNIHRRLDTAKMPAAKTVIQFTFAGVPAAHRNFWLVCEHENVEVCLKPPGFDVDIIVRTSVRVLAEVWRGIRPIGGAIKAETIQLEGRPALCRRFPDWLLLSVYAPISRKR